jgi:hypothetical protein
MNQLLQEALTGEAVTLSLGGKSYTVAFPVAAVILYQKETAKLDRQRREERRQQGIPALTREELRDLRSKRRTVIAEARNAAPNKDDEGAVRDAAWAKFQELLEEATLLKIAIDEEECKGDSLYDRGNWQKMDPDTDAERFILAVWVGTHTFTGKEYRPQIDRESLASLINFGNTEAVAVALTKALNAHIKNDDVAKEDADPNAPKPETTAPAEKKTLNIMTSPLTSPASSGQFPE